jgi:phosphoenolpyruvate-protein phosphotransferase
MSQFVLKGTSVSPGFALGVVRVQASIAGSSTLSVRRLAPEEVESEIARYDAAMARTEDMLRRNIRFAAEQVGDHNARIFESQLAFLSDVEIRDRVRREIRERQIDAAAAVDRSLVHFARPYEKVLPAVRRDLLAEVRSAWDLVLDELAGREPIADSAPGSRPVVIVTDELSPRFATLVERGSVAAVLAETGGRYSHGAILARSFGVPAVVGIRSLLKRVRDGMTLAVNGDDGTVLVDPTDAEQEEMEARRIARIEQRRELQAAATQPARTRDGVAVSVLANVESLRDLEGFDLRTIDGIGLYRTEFLYLDRNEFPTEDDQYHIYRRTLERLGSRPVVIRTLDSGGDKPLPYFQVPAEQNPALGWRGIRISLEMPDLFVPQLRAILRAAAHGDARILLPMVTSVDEVRAVRSLIASILPDLQASGLPFRRDVPIGVMVEVPAAALLMDAIAEVSDFVSLGTNDLVQYILGVDRDNPRIGSLYDPYHPAVLRVIADVASKAAARGREVSICGEFASDPQTAPLLIGFGLRALSMAPASVATVKAAIRAASLSDATNLASSALTCTSAAEVRERLVALSRNRAGPVQPPGKLRTPGSLPTPGDPPPSIPERSP